MSIDRETVLHMSKLARIALSEDAVGQMQEELGEILNYVAKLDEVATEGVRPTCHVHGITNAFREDISKDSLPVDAVARIAPDFAHGGFRVPKVI